MLPLRWHYASILGDIAASIWSLLTRSAILRTLGNAVKTLDTNGTKKRKFLMLTMTVVIMVTLGIGLALGLRRSSISAASNNQRYRLMLSLWDNAKHLSSTTSSLTTPRVLRTSPISPQDRILDDTSIAAVVLPSRDRQVYYQDRTTDIHKALYRFQTDSWEFDQDPMLYGARINTPLAAINGLNEGGYSINPYVSTAS